MNSFEQRVKENQSKAARLEKDLKKISNLRLLVFVGSAILITLLANARQGELLLIFLPVCVFAFATLVRRHAALDQQLRHTRFLQRANEQEVSRQNNNLSEFPDGKEMLIRNHNYVEDLDIFGDHSVFQLLNRTTMHCSHRLLGNWLLHSAPTSEILERQQAVNELAPMLEWRQDLQATGMTFKHSEKDYYQLSSWAKAPQAISQSKINYLRIATVPLALMSTCAAIYFFSHVLTVKDATELTPFLLPMLVAIAVNGFFLRQVKSAAEELTDNIKQKIKILDGYQSLIRKVQGINFKCRRLQQLASTLTSPSGSAATEIAYLKSLMDFFQFRGGRGQFNNFFYRMLNSLWLIDVHMVAMTQEWKRKNGHHLSQWTTSVHELEVLNSIAGFHYANPTFVLPEIVEKPFTIDMHLAGHPLIAHHKRVCNDFKLNERGEISMITGSNMAGKSTFLRTLGTNVVLALMGAPCCAKSASVSNLEIFSSMRTQDNLEEGVSSFYAELKRIERLLSLVETDREIFFLLDEMFKGTNSKDRQKGGYYLIRQLKDLNAFGIISTHDLELAVLVQNHKLATNYSFNSAILDGEMTFSYTLTEGICNDFNASELMRRSGIKIFDKIP